MKKSFRLVLSLLLMACLLCSLGISAFADSTVSYGTDRKFTVSPDTDLFDSFKNVMPGDTLTETITVVNQYRGSDYVKIYLKAVPHDETTGPHVAKVSYDDMMKFLSQLELTVTKNGNVIFDDMADQTGTLTTRKLLGTFEGRGQVQLQVTLSVPITMGNEFADCMGEIDWVFTAEEWNDEDGPRTGDNSHIFLYAGVLILSAAAAWFILFYLRRKKAE